MQFREAILEDIPQIVELYRAVAAIEGGIARTEREIDEIYISEFVVASIDRGLIIVGEHPEESGRLIAEIHAYKPGLFVFDHLLSNLTMVVHPHFQGKRIGRTLLAIFLEEIATTRPDIGKVELFARESNVRAIALYQSVGFRIEGRMEMRVKTSQRIYEADIPMGWQNPNFEF